MRPERVAPSGGDRYAAARVASEALGAARCRSTLGPSVRAADPASPGSRSVSPGRDPYHCDRVAGPFDHLFNGLAPADGWVQDLGSVEAAACGLDRARGVLIALDGGGLVHETAECLASAVWLARSFLDPRAERAGPESGQVTLALPASLHEAANACIARASGLARGRIALEALPEKGEQVEVLLATRRPSRVLCFESSAAGAAAVAGRGMTPQTGVAALVSCDAAQDRHVVLGSYPRPSYPRPSDLLAAAGRTPPGVPAGPRVSAPSAGDAGLAVASLVAARAGRDDLIPSPDQHLALIETAARALRTQAPGAPGRLVTHAARADFEIRALAELIGDIARKAPDAPLPAPDARSPFVIAAFDSSSGGLVAVENVADHLRAELALRAGGRHERPVRFLVVTDHGHAPYGPRQAEDLTQLVAAGLTGASAMRADVIMMACNTACTVLEAALERTRFPQGGRTHVVDLIETTVDAIKDRRLAGARPALFATQGTIDAGTYQSRLQAEGVTLAAAIACPPFADLVNENRHLSSDEADKTLVVNEIRKYVSRLPSDTTSVWLCCTHYPALLSKIQVAVDRHFADLGRSEPVRVIDPMKFQADSIVTWLVENRPAPAEPRGAGRRPVVLTTGDQRDVAESARSVLDLSPRAVHGAPRDAFGPHGDRPFRGTALAGARRDLLGLPSGRRDALLHAYSPRQVHRFAQPEGPAALSRSLLMTKRERVMLLTGFSVAQGKPETDGPPGTAVLARTLAMIGKQVVIGVDAHNHEVMRRSLGAICDPASQEGRRIRIVRMDGDLDGGGAAGLIDEHRPDAVVAIELPSRNAGGDRLNMRGESISAFNGTLDAVLLEARRRELFTAGIGDGGNEAGLGGVEGIPEGRYGGRSFDFAASIGSARPVTAWNSNFGAIATAMELASSVERSGTAPRVMPRIEDIGKAVAGAVGAGAIDGVTRLPNESVDGFSMDVHELFARRYAEQLDAHGSGANSPR